ncbi:transketolase [Escherichia coli]|nr:transketolase [Escherichia coli]
MGNLLRRISCSPFFGFTAENIVAKAHKVLGVKGA